MSESYRAAGVDVEAAAKAVGLIADLAATAQRPEVADRIGGFAGLFRISEGRLLAAATDGVGTKLEIARLLGRLDTVGVDLVAMCADDVVCTGAEPLFFLDYLAVGTVVPERVASIVEGVAEGCRRAGCALLGGETAEHPGVMDDDAFDLAGFCVGVVDEADLLGPEEVREGDVLIGLASSGLHANGYSLVRSALLPRYGLDEHLDELGRTLGDELLEPCTIHTPDVLALHRDGLLHAAAHITGGGIGENLPRALPAELDARIERGSWIEPPIFGLIQRAAEIPDDDMFATFNMGLGMVLVVGKEHVDDVLARTRGRGSVVGEVVPSEVERPPV
ncbi:MAG: phosphoribosylformylglycinamidine cyclo-ligase [Actinomycetota bacterium]